MIQMDERLSEALDECITAINSGSGLEECLAKYPNLADELRPLIETSTAARSLTTTHVPSATRNRSRTILLAHAAQRRKTRIPLLTYFRIPRLALSLAAVLVVLVFSFNGLIVTSAKTLPGDTLYPIKRVAETVRLQLTNNIETKQQIEADYNQQRTEEVLELLQLKRIEQISMEGKVQEISPELWVVSGIKIHVTPETRIIGEIHLGQVVEVEGSTDPYGWVTADELHLRYYEVTDVITEINSDEWTIGDIKLLIAPDAQINPALEIGDQARVLVYSSDNGRLYARAILTVASTEVAFEPFEISFSGIVEMISNEAVSMGGKTILLSDNGVIAKGVSVGSWAQITVLVGQDDILTALKLEPLTLDNETQQSESEERVDENNSHKNDSADMGDVDDENDTDLDDQDQEEAAEPDDESDGDNESDASDDEHDDGSGDGDGKGDEEETGDDSGSGDDEEDAVSEDDESDSEQDDPAEDDSSDDNSDEEPKEEESPPDDD